MTRPEFKDERLTREEAAAHLGLKKNTLAMDVVRGNLGIPRYQLGGRTYYRRSDLDAWLESRRVEVKREPRNLLAA